VLHQDAGGTDRALPLALLPLLSYLCPNELELQALTGKPTDTQEQVSRQNQPDKPNCMHEHC
jgi:pyridoxal/pyridoxine/pyridoxamine kinase